MTEITNLTTSVPVGMVLGVLLVACIIALLFMIDFRSTLARQYRAALRCPVKGRPATVDVSERFRFGLVRRTVRRCSLREEGESCNESCLEQLGRR